MARVDLDRARERSDRSRHVARHHPSASAVEISRREVGSDLEGAIVPGGFLRRIAAPVSEQAAVFLRRGLLLRGLDETGRAGLVLSDKQLPQRAGDGLVDLVLAR